MNILDRLKKGTSKLTITKLSGDAPAYVRAREQEIELMNYIDNLQVIAQQAKYAVVDACCSCEYAKIEENCSKCHVRKLLNMIKEL